eukprot:Gb_13429 [translate_table: standard]
MEPILKIPDDASSDINLDDLISHITQLLDAIKNSSEKNQSHWQWPTSSAFSKLREFLEKRSDFISKEKGFLSKLSREAKTVAISILKEIAEAHWPAAGLVVVYSILERFESISANKAECLQLLKAMNKLALHIKQLKDRANLREGMRNMIQESVCMIVEGSLLCCNQMQSSIFFNCRKTAVPRQKAYPEHAVGIEEQFDKVIQILELESEINAVAVILHGFGGMGKTTLADAVFARLDIKDVLNLCGIKTHIYSVEPLIPEAAKELFCGKSGANVNEIGSDEMQLKIVEICKGIPLMLDVVGGYIFSSQNKDEAYRKIIEWHKKGKAFSVEKEDSLEGNGLNFAFEELSELLKDPCLDICSFFTGWDWDKVAGIVGEDELYSLKKRALLRKEESNNRVSVHDVILRIGLNQTMGKRFTTVDGLREALEDNKDIHEIKGIWLKYDKSAEPFHIPAAQLDSMHNSLRILALGDMIVVDGKCSKKFEQLILFDASDGSSIPFGICTLKELRFLSLNKYKENQDLNMSLASPLFSSHSVMPPKLRMINLRAKSVDGSSPLPFEITGKVASKLLDLQWLSLWSFRGLRRLPEEISCWTRLKELDISGFNNLEEIPQGAKNVFLWFKELINLRKLNLEHCASLSRLPEGFNELKLLEELNLSGCGSLENLCSNFQRLASLQDLKLCDCTKLKEKWIESIVEIKTLSFVDIKGSEMLIKRWQELEEAGGSWHMAVRTGQDLENVEKILNKLASPFFNDEWSLIDCHDKPFCASTLRCNTILLFVVDRRDRSNPSWWPIEDVCHEQITSDHNIQIIYIGQYISEMPVILKDRTLAYASHNSPACVFLDRALSIVGHDFPYDPSIDCDFITTKLETESEEKDFLLVKHNTDQKVNVEDLQGKLVLLYIAEYHAHLNSFMIEMREIYVEFHDKYGYEVVSIPLNINRGALQRWSNFQEIVNNVPWLVMSNPWLMKSATMCFIEDEWQYKQYEPMLVVVEPNGRISNKNAMPMVKRFGAEAYPFTPSTREHDLKVADWDRLKDMSSLEFLFQTLEFLQTVKESMKEGKMTCFYGCYGDTRELSSLLEVVGPHNIQMVHVEHIFEKDRMMMQTKVTPSLNLSERDTYKFWRRLFYLKKEIKIIMADSETSARMTKLLNSFSFVSMTKHSSPKKWVSIMDKNGEALTTGGMELVEFLICGKSEGDEEVRKEVIRCFKEGQVAQVKSLLEKKIDDHHLFRDGIYFVDDWEI